MAQIATLSRGKCVNIIYMQYRGDRAKALSAAAGDKLAPKVFTDVIDDFKSLRYLPAYPEIEYKIGSLTASWTVEGSSEAQTSFNTLVNDMSDDYLRTVMLNRSIAMISMRTNGVSVRHIYSGKSNRGAKVVINKKAPNDNQPTVQAAQAKLNKSPIKLQGSFSRESDARLGTSPGSSLSNEKVAGKPTNAALPQVVRLTQFQPNTSVGTLETPVDDTAMTPSTSKPRDDVVAGTKRSYGGSTFVEGKMVERLAEHTEGSESTPHPSKRQKVDIISGTAQRDSVMIAVSDVYSRRPIPESEPVSSAVARPSTSKLQSDDSGTGKEGDLYTSLPAKNGSLEDGAKPFIDRGHQRTKMGESESRDRAPQVLVNESSTLACASTTNTEHQEFENNREGSRMEADGDLARKLVDLQSALDNERRERTRLQARLEEARQLEAELLKTIDDLKRERKDPIVVSAVMDAFIRISNLTNKLGTDVLTQ